jgi:hypothetical protein
MKSLKEYIGIINQQIRYKLFFYVRSAFGQKMIYQTSADNVQLQGPHENEIHFATVHQEILLEPMVVNDDIIPSYFKLNMVQLRSMYNLVCYSYWDDTKWNSLKERSMQSTIKSQLGFAMREALMDEYGFPALN